MFKHLSKEQIEIVISEILWEGLDVMLMVNLM